MRLTSDGRTSCSAGRREIEGCAGSSRLPVAGSA